MDNVPSSRQVTATGLTRAPWRLGLVAVALVLAMTPQAARSENAVTLASIEYPPYSGRKLEAGGMVVQIVREAYEQAGYQCEVRFYPWARAEEMAKDGRVDGVLPIWKRDERLSWFIYSDPLPASEVVFYTQAGRDILFDGADYLALKPYRIGTCRAYANPEAFDRVREQLQVELVADDLANLRKLAAGRLDLVVIDRHVASHLLRTQLPQSADSLAAVHPPLETEPNYVGISRRTAAAEAKWESLNRGLAALAKAGRIQAILEAHRGAAPAETE
jgi:polar amino acid transport system substrate-binding protein